MTMVAFLLLTLFVSTERQEPRFTDYPVRDVFRGKPTPPRLVKPWARMYRTCIREGVSKGYGVEHGKREGPGPNFAGHYFVITWGCGAGCARMAIVDALTGTVYPPPLSIDKRDPLALPHFGFVGHASPEFELNSRLFVMETCTWPDPPTRNEILPCATSYFIIEPSGFKLVKRVDWKFRR
ncbi:MAG TPA: hypothetical protein VGK99_03875 [Acidobacteriota bacterium]|jgi:hypothetical protein